MKTSLNIITVSTQDLQQKEETVEKHNKYEYANKNINKYTNDIMTNNNWSMCCSQVHTAAVTTGQRVMKYHARAVTRY